jgi:hypothetical protein
MACNPVSAVRRYQQYGCPSSALIASRYFRTIGGVHRLLKPAQGFVFAARGDTALQETRPDLRLGNSNAEQVIRRLGGLRR